MDKLRSRRFIHWLLFMLLGLSLAACGAREPEATPTVVISGPDVRPNEALPPTPTLHQDFSPTDEPTEVPALETTLPEASPTADLLPPTETVPATSVEEDLMSTVTPEIVEPTLEPTAGPPPDANINGMMLSEFIIMPQAVRDNVRAIYTQGQAIGRNANSFSILGDSLIATPQSLAQWDQAQYTLGDFAYLQPTIDHFAGSFGRYGPSVRVGLHSWSVFDPLWADKEFCLANENVLDCEIRLNNPSVMFVFLGSNDNAPPGGFKMNYDQVVSTLINNGIVPILATKADRFEGPDNANNLAIREVAAAYQVPLLEFDLLANTLPGRGLGPDGIHLTFLEPIDYTSPGMTSIGYPVHNLAALMILDQVKQETTSSP